MPGSHPAHIQRPFIQKSPFRHSYDLGYISFWKGGSIETGRDGKKGPQKRNTGLPGALYAPQFMGILAIGARRGAGLTSVEWLSDVVGGQARLLRCRLENPILRNPPACSPGSAVWL